jgi:hypothetical protein
MSLIYPQINPNFIDQPKLTVSGGVVNGDTVNIYDDVTCSTLLGSATASGASVEVTLNKLTTIKTYSFYAKSSNVKGSSACSANSLASYTYLGSAPTVAVSWNANKEKIVNRAGGGYRVYYSNTRITAANRSVAQKKEVVFNGTSTPTTVDIPNLAVGTYYFRVYAFGKLDSQSGESESQASDEFTITLP